MSYFDSYKGLPKSIYVIFFAQVINRFGDFVLPFLSLFLVKKLGLSYQSAGVAVMLTSLSSIPGSFAGGKIADHLGRKKAYAAFQLSAAICLFFCAFLGNPQIIIALICMSSFFNGGVRPIISAIITDVLPAEKRQMGFSMSYLGINLGVSLGPLVAGFLFNHYIPLIFIGDAITSLLAVTLVMINIKETLPDYSDDKSARDEEKNEAGNVFSILLRRPKILVFLIINTVLSVVYTQHNFSLPMMLDSVFGSSGASNYGITMSVNALTVITMTMFITHAIRKWKPLSAIAMSGLLYAIGFGMITFIHTMSLYILATLIWTIGEIMIVTNFGVYIANNTPQNYRARFNAVTSLSWAIGAALGTSLIGRYMDYFGVRAVWPLTFFLGLLGAAGMYLLKMKTEKADAVDVQHSSISE
ncbi:MAG TPA: MFS transporter [Clostridia bacterium]|nr:MFS transporter [Clostridia bacterium]